MEPSDPGSAGQRRPAGDAVRAGPEPGAGSAQPVGPAEAPTTEPRVVVYVRTYCHLCDEMLEGLERLGAPRRFAVEAIDVDDDPVLEARYGDKVPVLVAGGRELCHYRLDADAVAAYLSGFR